MATETEKPTDAPVKPTEKSEKSAEEVVSPAESTPPAAGDGATETAAAQPASPPAPKPTVHKVDFEKDVVYLYQFPRCPALPGISPFCLKVESYLRMTNTKYENVDHKLKYKSKKGQLPFIEYNGEEIADSDIIIKTLSEKLEKDLDSSLKPNEKAVSHAFCSMLNNHTGWVYRCWRYRHPGQFVKAAQMDIKRTLNSKLPKRLLQMLFKLAFKSNAKHAIGHGLGRHTTEEILEFGKADLRALSNLLGDKKYFFGDEPTLLDCTAFAHLCQFIYVPFCEMKEFMESECANLIALVERMKDRYWPDWEESCKTLDMNTHLPKPPPQEEKKDEEKKEEEKKDEEKKESAAEEPKKEEK